MHKWAMAILMILPFYLYGLDASFSNDGTQQVNSIQQVDVHKPLGADSSRGVSTLPQSRVKEIYQNNCAACHASGIAGAPKFRTDDWRLRLSKKNMDELVSSVVHGLNVMPPMGTCNDCSPDELKAVIKYMVPQDD